ncbi:MAG: hydroxymethylbilane synthase [Dehalococcoidia bacterium]
MAASSVIKVGSRGSTLALRQTEEVLEKLRPHYPDREFEVVIVTTQGDSNATAPLAGMGLGVFVKEIEQQLLSGLLDMAVHSLKDMPTLLPEGLYLGAMLPRQDARDVLVNKWNCRLEELPAGARIGTGSPRRKAQLKNLCPQVQVLPIRGNVETRLSKARGEDYDGAILAAAGMIRLGLTDQISEYLSAQQFVPPPGQGVLAVEVRADDDRMLGLLRPVEHSLTRYAATAERAFLEKLGGGCQVPVGAYAQSNGEIMMLTVFLGDPEGQKVFRSKVRGLAHDPRQLASDAYLALVERGGAVLLNAAQG